MIREFRLISTKMLRNFNVWEVNYFLNRENSSLLWQKELCLLCFHRVLEKFKRIPSVHRKKFYRRWVPGSPQNDIQVSERASSRGRTFEIPFQSLGYLLARDLVAMFP